jgi:hypothetical protein
MKKHFGLIVFVVVLGVYLLSLNGVWATDHPSSFIQLDWSIFANHSFGVNDSQISTNPVYSMDDFALNGTWFIASPPGLSFFSLPFVAIGFLIEGYTPFGYVLLLSEAFVALAGAISAYLLYKISRFYFQEKTSMFLGFSLGFSTLLWPFATYYFQHDVSAMFVLASVYLALKVKRNQESGLQSKLILFCGLAVACGLLVDYIDAIMIPFIAIYFLYLTRKLGKVLYYLVGAAVGIFTIMAYNFVAFGDPLKNSQNLYDGKPFLGDFSTPILNGLFMNFLSPYRGLFFYCPLVILAPAGYYLLLRKSKKDRPQILFLMTIMLSIVIPYSLWQDVTAGVSFGPRFLIPSIPFLIFPVGQVIEQGRSGKGIAYILYSVGAVFNGAAALVSVIHPNFPTIPSWTTEIFTYMLNALWTGYLDVWWLNDLGRYWWVLAGAIIAVPIVTILLLNRIEFKKEKVIETPELVVIPIQRTNYAPDRASSTSD